MDVFLPLIGCAILSALVGAIAYDVRIRRITVGAIGLLFLSAVAGAVSESVAALPETFETATTRMQSGGGDELLQKTGKEAFEVAFGAYLAEECKLNAEDVIVTAEGFDTGMFKAEKIKILLRGKARAADIVKIREAATKAGAGKCEVDIEIG